MFFFLGIGESAHCGCLGAPDLFDRLLDDEAALRIPLCGSVPSTTEVLAAEEDKLFLGILLGASSVCFCAFPAVRLMTCVADLVLQSFFLRLVESSPLCRSTSNRELLAHRAGVDLPRSEVSAGNAFDVPHRSLAIRCMRRRTSPFIDERVASSSALVLVVGCGGSSAFLEGHGVCFVASAFIAARCSVQS